MQLKEQITSRARQIRTDGYGMSIGEVISLYRDAEIDIHPEFQRIYRWKDEQKSRLIESILLGIPIPPIFVSQREDGIWDVIDGVQRLSTILEFTGEYRDEAGVERSPFQLLEGEYLKEMKGYSWRTISAPSEESKKDEDGPAGETMIFDDVLRRDFRRAKLEFRIITKESDPQAKYDLFQRLNSGSVLSPQEARNCLMVMMNKPMYERIVELSKSPAFRDCVLLSDRQEEQAYREELVLRFFCQLSMQSPPTELPKEYGEFVTDWMRSIALSDSLAVLDGALFSETFSLIATALSDDAFRRFNGQRHLGPFSISSFEFVTTGIASHIDHWRATAPAKLRERVQDIWSHDAFRQNSGTGVSPRRRVPRLVPESRLYFKA